MMIAGVIAVLALILIIAMYGLSAIFQVAVWLLTPDRCAVHPTHRMDRLRGASAH